MTYWFLVKDGKLIAATDSSIGIVNPADWVQANIDGEPMNDDGVILFKLNKGKVVAKTADEIAEETHNEPTQLDRIESQVLYTALLTDTLIESEV